MVKLKLCEKVIEIDDKKEGGDSLVAVLRKKGAKEVKIAEEEPVKEAVEEAVRKGKK